MLNRQSDTRDKGGSPTDPISRNFVVQGKPEHIGPIATFPSSPIRIRYLPPARQELNRPPKLIPLTTPDSLGHLPAASTTKRAEPTSDSQNLQPFRGDSVADSQAIRQTSSRVNFRKTRFPIFQFKTTKSARDLAPKSACILTGLLPA